MIQPEPEGSTQGYPLVSVEVLRTSGVILKYHNEDGNLLSQLNKLMKILFQWAYPVKEILLKLNLPDHRILKDGVKVYLIQLAAQAS
ncbi:hypothetical protein Tco_0348949 [Tanacetum coccineum]